jgi:hypothetical protein
VRTASYSFGDKRDAFEGVGFLCAQLLTRLEIKGTRSKV